MHKIGTDRDCCEKSLHIEIVQEGKETESVFLNHSKRFIVMRRDATLKALFYNQLIFYTVETQNYIHNSHLQNPYQKAQESLICGNSKKLVKNTVIHNDPCLVFDLVQTIKENECHVNS